MDVKKLLNMESYVSLSSLKAETVAEVYRMERTENGGNRVGRLTTVRTLVKFMVKTKIMIIIWTSGKIHKSASWCCCVLWSWAIRREYQPLA